MYHSEQHINYDNHLKQALNHGLVLKKVLKVIQYNQKVWFKTYIDVNTKFGKETKIDLEKISLS